MLMLNMGTNGLYWPSFYLAGNFFHKFHQIECIGLIKVIGYEAWEICLHALLYNIMLQSMPRFRLYSYFVSSLNVLGLKTQLKTTGTAL